MWSPKDPNLYQLETKVFIGEKEIDAKTTNFGIRVFTFDKENQLEINGVKTFLRGVNRHQDYPFIGYALSDNAQYRDAKKIKDSIRGNASPHHVPAKIIQVPELPRTISGKIVEIAVKKIVHNQPVKNKEALANPEALEYFKNLDELR